MKVLGPGLHRHFRSCQACRFVALVQSSRHAWPWVGASAAALEEQGALGGSEHRGTRGLVCPVAAPEGCDRNVGAPPRTGWEEVPGDESCRVLSRESTSSQEQIRFSVSFHLLRGRYIAVIEGYRILYLWSIRSGVLFPEKGIICLQLLLMAQGTAVWNKRHRLVMSLVAEKT